MKERTGKYKCPVCEQNGSNDELPTNDGLLKAIDHKGHADRAILLMKRYELLNPAFTSRMSALTEVVKRDHAPHELTLAEVTREEVVYLEHVAKSLHAESPLFAITSSGQSTSSLLDRRKLGGHQYTFKRYVFNQESIFMNYLGLTERTRLLFLFRRFNTCRHRHSCAEHIIRKLYSNSMAYVLMVRVPLYYLLALYFTEHPMENKVWLITEALLIGASCLINAIGKCLLRYLHEEVMEETVGVPTPSLVTPHD